MKTTTITKFLAISATALVLTFTACKKDKDEPGEDLRVANDNAKVDTDIDMAFTDVNEAFSKSSIAQRVASPEDLQIWTPPCGSSVDTTLLQSDKQITFTFDNTTVCTNRIRSGKIIAKLIVGNRWSDADAVLKITFQNYSVTYVATDIQFVYNGTKTITNLTGGLVRNLGAGTNVVEHKVRGNLSVTFEDGTQRNWWIARHNTYDYNAGNYRFITNGDTLLANPDTVLAQIPYSIGGTTRYGTEFLYRTTAPIVLLAGCGWDRPVDGQRIVIHNGRGVTVTLGVDALGNPAGGSCAYGYKIQWTRVNGQLGTAVIAY